MDYSKPATVVPAAPSLGGAGGGSGSAGPGSSSPEQKLHFLDYWRIIRIRKLIILAVFLLVVAVVTAVTYALTPRYLSSARMMVQRDQFDIEVGRFNAQDVDAIFFNTQVALLKSREILDQVVQQLRLNEVYAKRERVSEMSVETAYDILASSVDASPDRSTALVSINVLDPDKNLAADIANRIHQVYRDFRVATRSGKDQSGLKTLEKEYEKMQGEVAALQIELDNLRTNLNIPIEGEISAFPVQSLDAVNINRLETDRVARQVNFMSQQILFNQLVESDPEGLPHKLEATGSFPELRTLLSQINMTEMKRQTLNPDYGSEHPEVKRIVALMTTLRSQVAREVTNQLSALKMKMIAEKTAMEELTDKIREMRDKQKQEIKDYQPFVNKRRELANKERMRDLVQMEIMQQKVASQMGMSQTVRLTDRAIASHAPAKPNKKANIALGCLFGLLLGIGLAFFIEYLDTSVKTIDDVEQALGTAVLGVIPQNVSALFKEGPDSPHAEAYRVLRTNILFSRKDPNARTMTVVSGGAGEGKSTTIFNLATVFAQNGARVLIVDSDLRRPSLHKILGVSNAMGLTNVLMRQNKMEEAIQTTPIPGLDFLPSGKLPSSSVGVLNSAAMREFVQEVRNRYDFVFFDSPPIMGVSDASILAAEVDMAILVVQYRKYPQQMTLRAKQMVEKIGGKERLLGVVLNNINISQDSYYYYYSGYYYDYYSKTKDSKADRDDSDRDSGSSSGRASVELKKKY